MIELGRGCCLGAKRHLTRTVLRSTRTTKFSQSEEAEGRTLRKTPKDNQGLLVNIVSGVSDK